MPKFRYPIKPLDHMMATQYPQSNIPGAFAAATKNVKVWQHSVKKRWGYTLDRSLVDPIYNIICYQTIAGNRYTLYLTDKDLAIRQTGTSETFSYATQKYSTGHVSNISDANPSVVTGSGTAWDASGIAAGDKFILTVDQSSNIEPDAQWATVASVDSATQITLTGHYAGTHGAISDPNDHYIVRQIYSVPSNERWSYTIVDDNVVFTNGNVNAQYYNTTNNFAQDISATYAVKPRFCTAFADRLILADIYDSGARKPCMVRYSSNTNCLQFDPGSDATAGSFEILETEDYITGLGRVGPLMSVFKRDSITFYERSSESTAPLRRYLIRPGIGCRAPHSIVETLGTNVFLGKDDFYIIDGDYPSPIGEGMRYKFYDIVGETEAQNTWGFSNPMENEIIWIASTSEGKYAFVWDYKYREWYIYQFAHDMTGAGQGAI